MEEFVDIFNEIGKIIYIYLGQEISQDPEEEDKKVITYNPIPVKAIVNDLTSAQMSWKTPGLSEIQGKEIILENKWRNTIEQSYKIVIDTDEYVSWKDNSGKTQIRDDGSYIRLYIYKR
jgi:hypothetical protein